MFQRPYYLIELMDESWLPVSLRETLTDLLEIANTHLRLYNGWVARDIVALAKKGNFKTIVELGAGSAPIARLIAQKKQDERVGVVVCDSHPNVSAFKSLELQFPGSVTGIMEPVDFTRQRVWGTGALLLVNSCFHHVPPEKRREAIKNLIASADRVVIFEPLKREWLSLLLDLCGFIPAFLGPLFIGKAGRLRRLFWCWVFPVAPFCLVFDGIVSCLRMWSTEEWIEVLREVSPKDRKWSVESFFFSHKITI